MWSRSILHAERRYFIGALLAGYVLRLFARTPKSGLRSILVIKLDEIGDMATATHVFELLRQAHPGATITVLCKPFVAALLAPDKNIDVIWTSVVQWNRRFDAVVDLRGTWSTLWRTFRFRPNVLVQRATTRWRNKRRNIQRSEVETNFEIIQPLTNGLDYKAPRLYASDGVRKEVAAFLESNGIADYAVIAPGARSSLRRWPIENFRAIARHLYNEYSLTSVLVGGREDRTILGQLQDLCGPTSYVAPEHFTLEHLTALCERSRLFIGNESGPMHVAATFGIPLVGLFGPGAPRVFDPIGSRSITVHHVLECNPCDQITCVQPHQPCIQLITVPEVENAVRDVLSRLH